MVVLVAIGMGPQQLLEVTLEQNFKKVIQVRALIQVRAPPLSNCSRFGSLRSVLSRQCLFYQMKYSKIYDMRY